jgi:hypothetical protein
MTTNATGSKCQVARNVVSGGVMNSVHSWGRYHYQVMNDVVAGIVWSLAPTVLVGLLFWMIMRAIIRADRTERKVYSRMEAEERARRGLPHKP